MCLTLNVRGDVSVSQLSELARSRLLVKTPHVGNNSPNNLFAAQCGFPILWVDSTIPARDKNANPHLLIQGGRHSTLSDDVRLDRMLTTSASVTVSGFETQGFVHGRPLIEGHLNRMRSVFPETTVGTTSELYRTTECLTDEVFGIATDALPHHWYRVVQEDGTVRTFSGGEPTGISSWRDVCNSLHLKQGDQGWVVPNLFAILHELVRQSAETGAPEVWLLSGPDMIKYLPELMPSLREAYDAVRRKTNRHPELEIHLVPFTHFRFTVRKGHRDNLETLLRHVASGSRNQRERANLAMACPDLWAHTHRLNHFSQHDMGTATDLYAPEELKGLPLEAVQQLWENIRLDLPRKCR